MVGTLSLGHAVSQPFLSSRKVFNGLRIELLASHVWGQWTFAWVRFGPLGYPTGHHELVRARGSASEQKKKSQRSHFGSSHPPRLLSGMQSRPAPSGVGD